MCNVDPKVVVVFGPPGSAQTVHGRQGDVTVKMNGEVDGPPKSVVDNFRAKGLAPVTGLSDARLALAVLQPAKANPLAGAGMQPVLPSNPEGPGSFQYQGTNDLGKEVFWFDDWQLPGQENCGRMGLLTTLNTPESGVTSVSTSVGFTVGPNGVLVMDNYDKAVILADDPR